MSTSLRDLSPEEYRRLKQQVEDILRQADIDLTQPHVIDTETWEIKPVRIGNRFEAAEAEERIDEDAERVVEYQEEELDYTPVDEHKERIRKIVMYARGERDIERAERLIERGPPRPRPPTEPRARYEVVDSDVEVIEDEWERRENARLKRLEQRREWVRKALAWARGEGDVHRAMLRVREYIKTSSVEGENLTEEDVAAAEEYGVDTAKALSDLTEEERERRALGWLS